MTELDFIAERDLIEFVRAQRWFGSRSREPIHSAILDLASIRPDEPKLLCAVVEIGFSDGTREIYQVPVGLRAGEGPAEEAVIGRRGTIVAYDALQDPELGRELVQALRDERTVRSHEGATVEFRAPDAAGLVGVESVRPLGVDQSNSSIVLDERLLLKCYRRLEAGINPELELLRFLTEHGFHNVAAVAGWYAYSGSQMDASLGILQEFYPGARDGWALALELLEQDPVGLLGPVRRLGEVTGAMHATLASDRDDPAFAPETPSAEMLGLMTATIDEEIERVFMRLPEDEPAIDPIRGRRDDVREALRERASIASVGQLIRHHGDYHLGQALRVGDDWIIVDFEGEPARSLSERRRKRSPLRDVAGMLRSFAYAEGAARTLNGADVPGGWLESAREEFLAAYLPSVEASGLLPAGRDAMQRLLALFELEKAVYELRYELDNRPELLHIPVEGILRMLGAPA
ncbi:MAG: maltokinase N-terminal cap-like domain-containing protein [Gaiellaceae bacterium]